MTDLILGMGEVGSTLYDLLKEREIQVEGYDVDPLKSKLSGEFPDIHPEYMHVCIPYSGDFNKNIIHEIFNYQPRKIIIHSTVPVGTTAIISQHTEGKIPVFYSPMRGVHERFLLDMKRYQKFIAPQILQYEEELADRFDRIVWVGKPDALELAKILETTYYGYLIAFRKDIDKKFVAMKLDPEVFWSFCEEIQDYVGNRPIMYNDGEKIGGHCVLPNLRLLPQEFNMYKEIIGKWGRD